MALGAKAGKDVHDTAASPDRPAAGPPFRGLGAAGWLWALAILALLALAAMRAGLRLVESETALAAAGSGLAILVAIGVALALLRVVGLVEAGRRARRLRRESAALTRAIRAALGRDGPAVRPPGAAVDPAAVDPAALLERSLAAYNVSGRTG